MKLTKDNYFQDTLYLNYHTLKDFHKCEWLYAERKAGKVKEIDRPYFVYGHTFENTLIGVEDENIKIGWGQSKADKELKEEGIKFITPITFSNIKDSVKEMKRHPIFEKLNKGEDQVILTGKISKTKCKGMFDKIFSNEKVVRIVDWKTAASMRKFDPQMYTGQLAFYSLLAEQKYPGRKIECYLAVADKESYNKHAAFFQLSQDKMYEKRAEIKQIVTVIESAEKIKMFEPTRNIEDCWTCDHYNDCQHTMQNKFIIF